MTKEERKCTSDKCIVCDKKVKFLKEPFTTNYDKGVDILLYPHHGSEWVQHGVRHSRGNLTVQPYWAVICDECFKEKCTTN